MPKHYRVYEKYRLDEFIKESWKIEGLKIDGMELETVKTIHEVFIEQRVVFHKMLLSEGVSAGSWLREGKSIAKELEEATLAFTGNRGVLRRQRSLAVMIGDYTPLMGGLLLEHKFEAEICEQFHRVEPFRLHQEFERLHPFLDGNGRTGRMMWLAGMMCRGEYRPELGFLHSWYYQSLA